jgi:hypothetical protein
MNNPITRIFRLIKDPQKRTFPTHTDRATLASPSVRGAKRRSNPDAYTRLTIQKKAAAITNATLLFNSISNAVKRHAGGLFLVRNNKMNNPITRIFRLIKDPQKQTLLHTTSASPSVQGAQSSPNPCMGLDCRVACAPRNDEGGGEGEKGLPTWNRQAFEDFDEAALIALETFFMFSYVFFWKKIWR